MNLIQPILSHAKTRTHAPALVDGGREIGYGELAELKRFLAPDLVFILGSLLS